MPPLRGGFLHREKFAIGCVGVLRLKTNPVAVAKRKRHVENKVKVLKNSFIFFRVHAIRLEIIRSNTGMKLSHPEHISSLETVEKFLVENRAIGKARNQKWIDAVKKEQVPHNLLRGNVEIGRAHV